MNTKKTSDIKAVFFDLGNVLVRVDETRFEKALSGSARRIRPGQIVRFVKDSSEARSYNLGRITSSRFYYAARRRFGLKLGYTEFFQAWSDMIQPCPDMDELVSVLKSRYPHLRLILVSDTNEAHFRHVFKNFKVLENMDDLVLSYREGRAKPHSGLYTQGIIKAGVPARHILYFDDRKDLIKKARSMGIRAYHFSSPEQTRKVFKRTGLDLVR